VATASFYSALTNQLIAVAAVPIPITERGVNSNTFTGTISTSTAAAAGSLQIYDQNVLGAASTVVTVTLMDDTSGFPSARARLKTIGSIVLQGKWLHLVWPSRVQTENICVSLLVLLCCLNHVLICAIATDYMVCMC
jgi:hypothetical protein